MSAEEEKRLADELYARREQEGEWSDKPEKLAVSRTPSVVYSVRFSRPELEELRAAASAQGMTLSELIRRAVLSHVREVDVPNASVTQMGRGLILRWPKLPAAARTHNLELESPVTKEEPVTSAGSLQAVV